MEKSTKKLIKVSELNHEDYNRLMEKIMMPINIEIGNQINGNIISEEQPGVTIHLMARLANFYIKHLSLYVKKPEEMILHIFLEDLERVINNTYIIGDIPTGVH